MTYHLTPSSVAALFSAMSILAMLPSASVFAVVASAISSGFIQGAITAIGIVVGDFIFILVAIYGLSAIAERMDTLFILVKYCGAAYLIWLGIGLLHVKTHKVEVEGVKEYFWLSNFLSGLFLTLGDPQAILFYIGFFPAFLDLSTISILDLSIILSITALSVGGIKIAYAYLGDRARIIFKSSSTQKIINLIASFVMIGTGIFLLIKS